MRINYKTTIVKYHHDLIILFKNYKNNKLNGEYIKWHEDGRLCIQCNYKNGKYNGEYKDWYDDKQAYMHMQCNYKNGELDGEYKEWSYLNGQLCTQQYYKNGQLCTQQYYKNGKFIREDKII